MSIPGSTKSTLELSPIDWPYVRLATSRLARLRARFLRKWQWFWLGYGGHESWAQRAATRLGTLGAKKYRGLVDLALLHPRGYVAPSAEIIDVDLKLGPHVFIGERVVIASWSGQCSVALAERVQLHRDVMIEMHEGGSVTIGADAAIQARCLLHSAVESITIGKRALVASYCAFYSYDHGMTGTSTMFYQPLVSKGPIVLEDDVWLGVGVKVLANVTIGAGAVVAAGSVVTKNIPACAVAAGIPARVVKYRKG